ncbi:MAG: alpha-N-arabinofuranosidase [Bacteroidales bacterium]|nr:alpha-N-arabinofuranosidase [Prevotella sp.]MBR3411127.1 alpha-N-arabinofuranosidase [Bacteroidales bacterium]
MRKLLVIVAMLSMNAMMLHAQQLTLRLDKAETEVSPMLYGLMTEEINYSYEGGLYTQLIPNPSFADMFNPSGGRRGRRPSGNAPRYTVRPDRWQLSDTVKVQVRQNRQGGINSANSTSLVVHFDEPGLALVSEGYWGFPIRKNTTFKGSLYVKQPAAPNDGSAAPTPMKSLKIALKSTDGNTTYAETKVSGFTGDWKKLDYQLTTSATQADTKDARLFFIADEAGSIELTRVTLFAPSFKNRPNGLRTDLMEMMVEMNPKFLRFPGGNYLEGSNFANRFDWKQTIGNPDERPGHQSPWGYRSTDGLGLLEFLQWAEDIGGEPVVGVFAGYVLNGDHLDGDYVKPFIQDALDEIEYIIGDAQTTKWGAIRARDGHPAPFPLHYVEIGNEDFFDRSGSYPNRFKMFYEAIKTRYPQLQIISTVGFNALKSKAIQNPVVDVIDEHYYRNAFDMYRNAFQYDRYDRTGPKIFCGEWATREGTPTTNMNAALGDAAWMSCMERNSDICIMSCYAPLFVNVEPGAIQWQSDLIGYDVLNSYGSPSYWAQVMFAKYLGNKIVPVEATDLPKQTLDRNDEANAVFYTATTDAATGKTYLKLVNAVGNAQKLNIKLAGAKKVKSKAKKIELKSARPEDTNSTDNPRNIVPKESTQKVGKQFAMTLAPYSITVLVIE